MRLSEYVEQDATALGELVDAGDVTASELAHLAREAHDVVNPQINAVIEFYDDAETVIGADSGPFRGVPFFRKDSGPTEAGRLQERGSRLLEGNRCGTDSYFVQRARAGGLRILGRTTTPEFGTSGFSESALHGITRNPWCLKRTAGGSSAGSAAAVAAGIVPLASGGDGGGSIRTPASYCGLVGLNPSRGRISDGPDRQDANFGLIRNFVLCRTVRDMAAALDVLSGAWPGDPFVIVQPDRPYAEELNRPTGRLHIGAALTKWGGVDIEPEVLAAVEATASQLVNMGHTVEEISAPYVSSDYSKVLMGVNNLSFSGIGDTARAFNRKVNAETLEPMNLKIYEKSQEAKHRSAAETIEAIRKMRFDVGMAIAPFDVVLTPTMPKTAMPHGAIYCTTNDSLSAEEWMDADAALYQFLGVFNVTGHPSVSLPLAQSGDGLPIGIQLVGRFGDEATLVRLARDFEQAMPWSNRRPPVHAGAR